MRAFLLNFLVILNKTVKILSFNTIFESFVNRIRRFKIFQRFVPCFRVKNPDNEYPSNTNRAPLHSNRGAGASAFPDFPALPPK